LSASFEYVHAQDPEFTQFYGAPLYLNPALAGTGECNRISSNYRNQWMGIDQGINGGYQTYNLEYDGYFSELHGGVGAFMLNDASMLGVYTQTSFGATYAYRMRLSKGITIQMGLQGGWTQKKVDVSQLRFRDQYDLNGLSGRASVDAQLIEQVSEGNAGFADFAAGALVYGEFFYGGFAVKHLTKPTQSFLEDNTVDTAATLPRKLTLHGGFIIPLSTRYNAETFLAPEFLYTRQGPYQQLNMGVYWNNGMIFAGGWARFVLGQNVADALIPYAGFKYDMFKISYSYDITISSLSIANTLGSHELALEFTICGSQKNTVRFCPRFF